MKNYKQLTYEQRCQIHALKGSGFTQQAIGETVGVSQSAISRELARNTGHCGYRFKQAQERCDERRENASKAVKLTLAMKDIVALKLKEKWSPEQISGWLMQVHGLSLSHTTIYAHIRADKSAGGVLYKSLRRKGKAYQGRSAKAAGRGCIRNRVSIDERPKIVDDKGRLGDWEIDLVIGKGHSGALVTIVERQTSFTVSKRIFDKSAKTVTAATIELLAPYAQWVLSITADNGKEFAYHEQMTQALGAPVYFADPYSSWQRGLNENTNGLLREYWPKCTDFKKVSSREVSAALEQLNDRPRKKNGYETPANLLANHMAASAT